MAAVNGVGIDDFKNTLQTLLMWASAPGIGTK
jgi:hypothetical protein